MTAIVSCEHVGVGGAETVELCSGSAARVPGGASSRGSNNTFIMLQLKLAADSLYHFEQGLVYFNNVKTFHRVFFLQTTK